MNFKQKIALTTGTAVVLIMALFPPWVRTFSFLASQSEVAIGYFPLYEPPPPERDAPAYGVRVDAARWSTQLLVTILVTGVAVVLLKDPKKELG